MANLYKEFGTDQDQERDGIWIEYGDEADGNYSIKLARAGGNNKRFAKVLERKSRPHRRKLETNTASAGLAEKLLIETFAETVVLDWKNITDAEGKEFPFSKKNCIKLFTDLPDLFAMIRDEASAMVNFQQVGLEEDEKNL